jgi:hypothetical protein
MIWVIQIIICIYFICVAVRIIQLQKCNSQMKVIHVSSDVELIKQLQLSLPTLLYNKDNNKNIDQLKLMNINYNSENISLSKYNDPKESFFIFKDKTLPLNYNQINTNEFPDKNILLPPNRSLTAIRGNHKTSIQRNIHNYMFIETIDGYSIVYLIHPKYKELKHDYKEIGYKLILQPNTKLYIPPNWYYVQEIDEKVIQIHTEIDDFFTCVPNFLKKNIHIL